VNMPENPVLQKAACNRQPFLHGRIPYAFQQRLMP